MSNTNIIFCKNHSNRKAYRFCDICKEFICNSCAFNEKHITHLQNIKSFKEILKTFFPNINYQNISHLSKYIEIYLKIYLYHWKTDLNYFFCLQIRFSFYIKLQLFFYAF